MFAYSSRAFALTAAAMVLLPAAFSPARAANVNANTTLVRYHDLDLARPSGEAALKQRIARAANTVCRVTDGRTLEDRARFEACRDNAIASASPQMNAVIASVHSSDHRYAMNNDAIAMLGR